MLRNDFSTIIKSLKQSSLDFGENNDNKMYNNVTAGDSKLIKWKRFQPFYSNNTEDNKSFLNNNNNNNNIDNSYQLINVPLVFHILSKQNMNNNNKNDPTYMNSPYMANEQRDYAIRHTNELYNIYDKNSKINIQFINFIHNKTIIHDNYTSTKDCNAIPTMDLSNFIKNVNDWEYKFHVFICESNLFSGLASFPFSYSPTNPLHNMIRVDYRALGCYDHYTNKYLCNNYNNITKQPISHSRWWRTRSVVLAHEFGHIFGLYHTFQGLCLGILGDAVPDTPFETTANGDDCPGLLPYDKDRDLFDVKLRNKNNKNGNNITCGSENNVCRNDNNACASCCKRDNIFSLSCKKKINNNIDVSEDDNNFPICCSSLPFTQRIRKLKPINSCKLRKGIDPKNNVMSYSPDYCMYELTSGQLIRMMTQIRRHKKLIYCNYANIIDDEICTNDIPCTSISTNPRCLL